MPNYVINKSNEHFTQEQLSLLNKGLNFAIRDLTFSKGDIVIDIDTGIKCTTQEEKADTREEIRRLLIPTKRMATKKRSWSNHHKTIKQLKEKPVFILPADKGNAVVIIHKGAYDGLKGKGSG